jgi:hypothetical protein
VSRRSQAWKALEREAAEALGGRRVMRGADFSVSDVDVIVDDMPHLKIDAKYRVRHSHHTLIDDIVKKYCKTGEHEPVLVTKSHRQNGSYVTIRLSFLSYLLMRERDYSMFQKGLLKEAEDDGTT